MKHLVTLFGLIGTTLSAQEPLTSWPDSTRIVTVSASDPLLVTAVKSAISRWNLALKKSTFEFVDSGGMVVFNPVDRYSGIKIGETAVEARNGSNIIVHVNVEIALVGDQGRPFTPDELVVLVEHELPHTLGIEDHSPVRKSRFNSLIPLKQSDWNAQELLFIQKSCESRWCWSK